MLTISRGTVARPIVWRIRYNVLAILNNDTAVNPYNVTLCERYAYRMHTADLHSLQYDFFCISPKSIITNAYWNEWRHMKWVAMIVKRDSEKRNNLS